MKRLLSAIALLTTLMSVRGAGPSLNEVLNRLDSDDPRSAEVSYEVLMPSAADPVTYTVELSYRPTDGDRLCPCDYLIDWTLHRGNKNSHGFNAYYTGNHFRFRDIKLQEYHFSDDSIPFLTGRGGVQRQAQFADLLPPLLASEIREMITDSTYSINWNPETLTLTGSQRIKGYDAKNFEYRFSPGTLLPSEVEIEYNPASISEQSVSVTYRWQPGDAAGPVNENMLSERYADVFERFRTSTFKIENLTGSELPSFTAVTPTRERYSRQRGEPLSAPTLLVFLDPAVASSSRTLADIRGAVSSLPKAVNTLYVFDRASADEIEALTGAPMIGETMLTNASSLSRALGVTTRPTFIIVDSGGIIRDIIIGVNKDLEEIVIQKMTLIN